MGKYSKEQTLLVQIVYLLGILLWFLFIFIFKLYRVKNFIEISILFIPVIIFFIAYLNAKDITTNVETFMFQANLLTLGLLVTLPLINWANEIGREKDLFIVMTSTAIVLSMFSLVDIWVGERHLCIAQHIKSIFQTLAIFLLSFGLIRFFLVFKVKNITTVGGEETRLEE